MSFFPKLIPWLGLGLVAIGLSSCDSASGSPQCCQIE
jgi:hypothetical protein